MRLELKMDDAEILRETLGSPRKKPRLEESSYTLSSAHQTPLFDVPQTSQAQSWKLTMNSNAVLDSVKESDVGITEFVSLYNKGFSGIVKKRLVARSRAPVFPTNFRTQLHRFPGQRDTS